MYNIKNVSSMYFLFTIWKKKLNKRNEKKLKRKKIKGKEISFRCMERYSAMRYSWCYCRNILFEDDGANIFCACYPT